MNILVVVILVVFAAAAVLALIRLVIGPSILDRAVAADVLLTEVVCILGADMVINQHTRSLPAMLIIAGVTAMLIGDGIASTPDRHASAAS